MWNPMNEEASDVAMDCASFQQISRDTPPVTSSASLSATRLSNMDAANTSMHDEMAVDVELSFYDDDNDGNGAEQRQRSAFSTSPLLPLEGLLSPERSPRRFHVVEGSSSKLAGFNAGQKFYGGHRQQKLFCPPSTSGNGGVNNNTTTTFNGPSITISPSQPSGNGNNSNAAPNKSFRVFHSLSSGSMESSLMEDDEFMELLEMESLEEHMMTPGRGRNGNGGGNGGGAFPSNLSSLIVGQIKSASPSLTSNLTPMQQGISPAATTTTATTTATTTFAMRRPSVRRCLSMIEQQASPMEFNHHLPKTPETTNNDSYNLTPFAMRLQNNATSPATNTSTTHHNQQQQYHGTPSSSSSCFKRPDPPSNNNSPNQPKRYRPHIIDKENQLPSATSSINNNNHITTSSHRSILRKSMSMNDAEIMSALARSDCKDEPDLIGDFSKPFVLPLMAGRHQDLKSISCETVARLLSGDFDNVIADYLVVDCRYPYEYDGGHIRGAKNLYTQEQIVEEFLTVPTQQRSVIDTMAGNRRRNIIIFHCEFSSERGPKLSRFLRNTDRARNTSAYPTLDYPEIYLLHNGYKAFFETHSELCEPVAYRPMLEPAFSEAYRHFRAKSKSWNGDGGTGGGGGAGVVADGSGTGGGTTTVGIAGRFKKPRSRLML